MISHSSSVLVSRSLQVLLPASQPTESAVGGEPCGEPAIPLHSHHVSLVQWTTCLLPVTRDPGSKPLWGDLCDTGILSLVLYRYRIIVVSKSISMLEVHDNIYVNVGVCVPHPLSAAHCPPSTVNCPLSSVQFRYKCLHVLAVNKKLYGF